MDELKRIGVFTRVVEAKSFSEAARQLGVAKSAVSKQVSLLEKEVGVRLMNRSTRKLSLTEAGQIYYQHCVEIVGRAEIALNELRQYQHQPTGTLRVASPVAFGVTNLVPVVKDLRCTYPQLKIDLLLEDRVINMVEEGVDLSIRIGWLEESNLVARKLGESPMVVVASPDYLARCGTPTTPEQLSEHQWLSLSLLSAPLRWNFRSKQGEHRVQMQSFLKTNSADALLSMAIEGLGVTVVSKFMICKALQQGQLVTLLDNYQLDPVGVYAVYPHRGHMPPKIRVFLDFLSKRSQYADWRS
ncbi:MAG: LysR family transcriptional regulator [Motiliproteus sp.]|nr:LysR family transcriptional regulator [Motiliproteus sp.]MCW9053562.1 LysR family transcriptional regulator [Motiliproteus sp.]